jgi:hypothetical protein
MLRRCQRNQQKAAVRQFYNVLQTACTGPRFQGFSGDTTTQIFRLSHFAPSYLQLDIKGIGNFDVLQAFMVEKSNVFRRQVEELRPTMATFNGQLTPKRQALLQRKEKFACQSLGLEEFQPPVAWAKYGKRVVSWWIRMGKNADLMAMGIQRATRSFSGIVQ